MNIRLMAVLIFTMVGILPVMAAEALSSGQALYLPIYSYIWHGDRVVDGKTPLKNTVSALVSIRNTSLKTPIRVSSARYYSTHGKLIKQFISKPVVLGAMGTLELFVERKESEGGSGANFVIEWDARVPTNPPLVEAVHADIKGHQTLTFVTVAHPIQLDK
jgi:hypothetical protein